MNWKQFLKPDKKKITLLTILLATSLFVEIDIFSSENSWLAPLGCPPDKGFPIGFLKNTCCEKLRNPSGCGFIIEYGNLVVDLIFWYFISCAIVLLYSKIRQRF